MGAIHTRRGDTIGWEENRTATGSGKTAWGVRTKPYFEAAETGMLLRVVESAPQSIGEERFGPGDAIQIEPNTVYGPLQAGPQGVRFILMFTGAPGMKSA